MKSTTQPSGLSRRQSIALLIAVALIGLVLAAFSLGLYEAWIVKPREASEARNDAARFAEGQKIDAFQKRLDEELDSQDEQTVVARLGQPDEKVDLQYLSDGKTHPLWRYKYPPVIVSFCDGRVERVQVELSKGFPRELLDSIPSSAGQSRTERNLYPLKLGNKWEYTFWARSEPETKIEIVTSVIASEVKNSRITATLSATGQGEPSKEEQVMSDEHGVYRNGVSGLNSNREFPIIKYPVKFGDTWDEKVRINGLDIEMNFIVGDAVEVHVPAGSFKAIPITTSTTKEGHKISTKRWFVDGVGLVKETRKVGVLTYMLELKKFTQGK